MTSIIKGIGAAAIAGTAVLVNYCTKERSVKQNLDSDQFYHGTTKERWNTKEGDIFYVRKHLFVTDEGQAKRFAREGVSIYRPDSIGPEEGNPITVQFSPVNPETAKYKKGFTGYNYFIDRTPLQVVAIANVPPLSPDEKNTIESSRFLADNKSY